jgi:type III secretion system HrpE/YscL family protein
VSLSLLYRHPEREVSFHGTLIGREAFAVLREADVMLRDAEVAAQALEAQSAAVLQAHCEEARREGFQAGRMQGITAVVGTLEVERALRELLVERLSDVVEQCVRSMLGDLGSSEAFRQRARQLLRSAAPSGGATLHVSPSQAHLARDLVAELSQEQGGDFQWLRIQSDDNCEPDALILETQVGFVDASVELTLASMREAIRQAFRHAEQQLDQADASIVRSGR